MSSLRYGRYDEPSATSGASNLRSRRRGPNSSIRPREGQRYDEATAGTTRPGSALRRALPLADFSGSRRRPRSPESSDPSDFGASRAKRRRLDPGPAEPAWEAIKYGTHGQVKPGNLKMELVSCDGGEQTDHRSPHTYLGPDNILRHDRSVYCSERPTCNIVLQHKDDTPFCLDKIHIVGPEQGFAAPVREGVVYVTMRFEDLRKYIDPPPHARRRDWSPRRRQNRISRLTERITLPDALRDPIISAAMDADNDANSDARYRDSYFNDLTMSPEIDLADDSGSSSDCIDSQSHPRCTTMPNDIHSELSRYYDGTQPLALLSDEEPGPEEISSQDVLSWRDRRERAARPRRFDSDSDRSDEQRRWQSAGSQHITDGSSMDYYEFSRLNTMMGRSRVHELPQPSHDPEDREAYRRAVEENMGGVFYEDGWKDSKVTRARFYIRQGKHKVTIRFSPALSGRFILLQLWSHESTVDVQSIIAKGYGGCRFFPAIELR